MNNLNSILIEGNLVRDPEMRSTPKGTQVCNFTLASNRYFQNQNGYDKEVSFFDVESWGKLAESTYSKGKKGKGVRVVGRLRQNRWESADGKKHSKITIIAEHIEFRPNFGKPVVDTDEELASDHSITNEFPPEEERIEEPVFEEVD